MRWALAARGKRQTFDDAPLARLVQCRGLPSHHYIPSSRESYRLYFLSCRAFSRSRSAILSLHDTLRPWSWFRGAVATLCSLARRSRQRSTAVSSLAMCASSTRYFFSVFFSRRSLHVSRNPASPSDNLLCSVLISRAVPVSTCCSRASRRSRPLRASRTRCTRGRRRPARGLCAGCAARSSSAWRPRDDNNIGGVWHAGILCWR